MNGPWQSRSFRSLVYVILLLVIVNLLWLVRPLLGKLTVLLGEMFIPFVIGLIIAYLLHPIVTALERRRVPRMVAVLLIYVLFILAITIGCMNAIPVFAEQLMELADDMPRLMGWYHTWMQEWEAHKYFLPDSVTIGVDRVLIQSQEKMAQGISSLVNTARDTLGKLLAYAVVPFIAFYLLKDMKDIQQAGISLLPERFRKQTLVVFRDINDSLGKYIHGQMIVGLVVGFLAFIGYWLIDMPYPFVLASLVCVTNIIPYVGPLIGAAPALVVALTISTQMVLFVLIVNVIIQVLEGNILSPNIVGRSLHLHPLLIIMALLVGEVLGGIIGMIVAVPVLVACKVVISRIALLYHES